MTDTDEKTDSGQGAPHDIEQVRQSINRIDSQIIALLAERRLA